jgi:hypothetical protein
MCSPGITGRCNEVDLVAARFSVQQQLICHASFMVATMDQRYSEASASDE